MANKFIRLEEIQALADLINTSNLRPVLVFKHSLTCPASAAAYEELARFEGEVVLVEVQNSRELSREIERRTGVTHQSPQVILLRNGQVVWSASHFNVKAEAITEAVKKHSSSSHPESTP